MDVLFKEKWLKALRSGEYAQCRERLMFDGGYCCLGVAAIVAGYELDTKNDRILRPGEVAARVSDSPSYSALDDFGVKERAELIHMNDSGKSFAEIADFIEKRL